MTDTADLENRFTYHAPKGDQADRYGAIRELGLGLANRLHDYCPESHELSLAYTKIDEAIMWANASIARNE
jgi:hypothetical protein